MKSVHFGVKPIELRHHEPLFINICVPAGLSHAGTASQHAARITFLDRKWLWWTSHVSCAAVVRNRSAVGGDGADFGNRAITRQASQLKLVSFKSVESDDSRMDNKADL